MAKIILNLHYQGQVLEVQEATRDASSFFLAIVRALNDEQPDEMEQADYFRACACQQIEKEAKHYRVQAKCSSDFSGYLARIKPPGSEVDNLIIQAMADYLQMDIILIQPAEPKPISDANPTPDLTGTHEVLKISHNLDMVGGLRGVIPMMPLIIYCDNRKSLGEKDLYGHVINSDNLETLSTSDTLIGTLPATTADDDVISPMSGPDLSNFDDAAPHHSQEFQDGFELELPNMPVCLDELDSPPSPPKVPSPLLRLMEQTEEMAAASASAAAQSPAASSHPVRFAQSFGSDSEPSDSEVEDELETHLSELPLCPELKKKLDSEFFKLIPAYRSRVSMALRALFDINATLLDEVNIDRLIESAANAEKIAHALFKLKLYDSTILNQLVFVYICEANDCAPVFISALIILHRAQIDVTLELIQKLLDMQGDAKNFAIGLMTSKGICVEKKFRTTNESGSTPILGYNMPYYKSGHTHLFPAGAGGKNPLQTFERISALIDSGAIILKDGFAVGLEEQQCDDTSRVPAVGC